MLSQDVASVPPLFPGEVQGSFSLLMRRGRGKSSPARLEEPRDQMDHEGLPLMAETTGSCSAPTHPQWGTAGVLTGEAEVLGGEWSSCAGNMVLLLGPIDQSVRGLSLRGCF